MNTHKRILG